jgi:RNA polymerase sigma-70 factor (ECF subfamily)
MTDEALVAAWIDSRDESLFRELVERHQEKVFRLVASVLGPFRDIDAEETAQDVFVRVHDKLPQFRGDAKFTTWLYRVAYSVAVNRTQSARVRLPHVDVDALRALASADDPHRRATDAERDALVAAAVESLPEVYRTVIYLHYWNDVPLAEIAELLCAPAGTIKSYLFRARARLARILEGAR